MGFEPTKVQNRANCLYHYSMKAAYSNNFPLTLCYRFEPRTLQLNLWHPFQYNADHCVVCHYWWTTSYTSLVLMDSALCQNHHKLMKQFESFNLFLKSEVLFSLMRIVDRESWVWLLGNENHSISFCFDRFIRGPRAISWYGE